MERVVHAERRRAIRAGPCHAQGCLVERHRLNLVRRQPRSRRRTMDLHHRHRLNELVEPVEVIGVVGGVVVVGIHLVADGVGKVGAQDVGHREHLVERILGDTGDRVDDLVHIQAVVRVAGIEDGEELVHAGLVVGLGIELALREIALNVGGDGRYARRGVRPVRGVVHAVEDDATVGAVGVAHVMNLGRAVVLDLHRAGPRAGREHGREGRRRVRRIGGRRGRRGRIRGGVHRRAVGR